MDWNTVGRPNPVTARYANDLPRSTYSLGKPLQPEDTFTIVRRKGSKDPCAARVDSVLALGRHHCQRLYTRGVKWA